MLPVTRVSVDQLPVRQLSPNYSIGKLVGKGQYGTVYKCQDKHSKEYVALKRINTDKEANGFPKTALREINLLKTFNHPNIVQFQEVVMRNSATYIVLEYVEHDLASLKGLISFQEHHLVEIMRQILKGIVYLHERGVYHRDLKPNNILYGNCIKICDFGLSNEYNPQRPQTKRVMIPQYRAPEIYLGCTYDCKVDVWSLGILFIELLLKKSPFQISISEAQIFNKITDLCGTPNESNWEGCTKLPFYYDLVKIQKPRRLREYLFKDCTKNPLIFDLIDQLLTLNPANRITAQQALEHEIFAKHVQVNLPKVEESNKDFKQPPQKRIQTTNYNYLQGI
ncbi:Cyclin-dependent kinase 13 [Paramecium bursaria]